MLVRQADLRRKGLTVVARRWSMMGTLDEVLIWTLVVLMSLLVMLMSILTKPSALILGVTVRFTPTS